ncbi:MAG: hypothetical protein E7K72_27625, partial [Roseomonas mucosa]|nr:hypothetical protein [Roseomonas mucosa]
MTSWTKTLTAFRRVTTRQSDTLQRVAAREMGDAALWVDLASINGLAPPYVTTSATEAAASAGTLHLLGTDLSVPATAPQATGVTQDDVYGTDIALTRGLIT